MTFAERLVRVCEDALAAGPMGDKIRGTEYREFIRARWPLNACMIGWDDRKRQWVVGGDIGQIHTSCAVFAGSASWHAGLDWPESALTHGLRCWGKPMEANWYQLSKSHPAFSPFPHHPSPGDVFNLGNSHVGVCLAHLGGGRWRTAEGGGGDGTKCQISEKRVFDPKRPRAWDPTLNRSLVGFYRAAIIGQMLGESPDTEPAPPPRSEQPTKPEFTRDLRLLEPCALQMQGADVAAWQALVGIHPHGRFDHSTHEATKIWQAAHGLVGDGWVGPKTRAKAGL